MAFFAENNAEIRLLKKIQKGNTREYKKIYKKYSGKIYALALRMTGDPGYIYPGIRKN